MDHKQAVIYTGPWKAVVDDDGHTLRRGEPMAVCAKTYEIYCRPPYAENIVSVATRGPIAAEAARPFDCRRNAVRDPRETMGDSFMLPDYLGRNQRSGLRQCC